MVWQAFIDDSYKLDGYFVLAGYVATAERWAAFAKEWEALLPTHGILAGNGNYHFKMSAMASPERRERVSAFYRVIEDHAQLSVAVVLRISDLKAAFARISIPDLDYFDWGAARNNYIYVFRLLFDLFHYRKDVLKKIIPLDEKVDFIFDKQAEQKQILASWDRYADPYAFEVRKLLGAHPRFEDDQEFLPLQAADFWAWWVRKWAEDGVLDEKIGKQSLAEDFENFKSKKTVPWVCFTFNEELVVENLKELIRSQMPERYADYPIYDVRFFWDGKPLS